MGTIKIIIFGLILFLLICNALVAQPILAPDWDAGIVKIMKGGSSGFSEAHGTGFLVSDSVFGHLVVTNRHLIGSRDSLYIIMNYYDVGAKSRTLKPYPIVVPLITNKGNKNWLSHPDSSIDIALIRLPPLDTNRTKVFSSIYPHDFIAFDSLRTGEFVYFYGFPLGIREYKSADNVSIVRGGIISYKAYNLTIINGQPLLPQEFLIDAFSFGGNSGSPVLTSAGTNKPPRIAGLIVGHIADIDVNTGLAKAISSDKIVEIINLYRRLFDKLNQKSLKE